MSTITANDLKTRGVAAIEATLADRTEAVVSVRGTDRYVVMELAQYHYLRECELEAALAQSRSDLAEGRYVKESPREHVQRVQTMNSETAASHPRKAGATAKAAARPQRSTASKPASAKATRSAVTRKRASR